ncbi:MAG: shikimate dehydrogenase [Pseudomonadota bacterium]
MTLKAGVVGWPIAQSKSPRIHGYWIKQHRLDATYEPIALSEDEFETGIRDLISEGFKGLNVTIPHKEAAFRLADKLSDRAQAIGAVNTLVFREDHIFGDNTDGIGFSANIKAKYPSWKGGNAPAAVFGAGGAARGIVWALLEIGYNEVRVFNRTVSRSIELASSFGDRVHAISGSLDEICKDADFFVNTTSVGMNGKGSIDVDLMHLKPDAIVSDIVYSPLETDLLRRARLSNFRTVDGLGMLLHQAVPGFEAWFDTKPVVTDELRQLVLS